MGTPSSVCVDNDLSSSETSISIWSTNNEFTRRIDNDLRFWFNVVLGDDFIHNILNKLLSKQFVLRSHLVIVLS